MPVANNRALIIILCVNVGAMVAVIADTSSLFLWALHLQAGRLPSSDSLSKLSEAQSLLAARDVLLACDRTTSGGDTYLVVSID